MPIARLLTRPHVEIALAYLVGYVALDWLSFIHPFAAYGITPWNPQTGLSFALVLLFGIEFVPWLAVAPLAADVLVRGLPLPIWLEVPAVLAIASGYGLATGFLLTSRIGFDPALGSSRSLLQLILAAVASAAVVAAIYVTLLAAGRLLPSDELHLAFLRLWIGDVIGITVVTPFLLILMTRRTMPKPSGEMLLILALGAIAFWVVFGFSEAFRLQLFYVFFLPLIWAAVRFGIEGVTAGLVITQVGLITASHFTNPTAIDFTAFQALMVVLAATALALGGLVTEQQRTQAQLALNQEALNRAFRLGTMGEFAAAVAHEINQPLTAIANYTRLAKRAAEKQPPDAAAAAEAASHAVAQVDRAAEVVRRLRDFIRLGRRATAATPVHKLLEDASSYCRAEVERLGVLLELSIAGGLPPVAVDALQIEQVVVNLVRNAAEALADAGRVDGKVRLEARQAEPGWIMVRVRDNGPGFEPEMVDKVPAPFTTTKPTGLGLGLALSRSVVAAHGGELTIESGPSGAVVSFTIPIADASQGVA
jgi:signal transduction histidine kinase